jgi:hypothetical protein
MWWIPSVLAARYVTRLIASGSWVTITDKSSMKMGGIILISRCHVFHAEEKENTPASITKLFPYFIIT